MPMLEQRRVIRETYEVERFLAEGAFAEVYRVRHCFLGRQAMKVFKQTGMSREGLDEMMAEAVLLSRIGHPNIVRVFDANTLEAEQGSHGYFTMEYVPGGSLDKFWRSHGAQLVPVETTVDILRQVCRGLSVAHAESPPIIHRDIKPQNILIGYETEGLRARLTDFGLAKHVNPLTLMATAGGTIAFKPPECFLGERGDSTGSDVWALGVTLYLLLTDKLPYDVDPLAGWDATKAGAQDLSPPSQHNLEADRALDRIALRCLALRPEERYADASELLSALEGWKPHKKEDASGEGSSISQFSKEALGTASGPDREEAEELARQAVSQARQEGLLMDAADLMEEAFNKWPSLREKYATQVQLWRRGISM